MLDETDGSETGSGHSEPTHPTKEPAKEEGHIKEGRQAEDWPLTRGKGGAHHCTKH